MTHAAPRLVLTATLAAFVALPGVGCVNQLGPSAREIDADHDVAFVAQGDDLQGRLVVDGDGYVATPALERDEPFNRIAIRFDAPGSVTVEARARSAAGWSAWAPMTATYDDLEAGAHNAHVDVAAASTAAQLRFHADVGATISFLVVETFEFFPDPADADLDVDADPSANQSEQGLAADGIAVTRSQWGARARECGPRHSPRRLTIHHTDTPNDDTLSMPARIRQIQSFHINSRGWCDIGYHFLIGQNGQVYQGRRENVLGAHAAGANTDNVGISFVGTFSDRAPSTAMLNAAARAMRSLANTYGITLDRTRVQGHRQVGTTSTSCPGDALYNRLGDLITLARTGGSTDQPPPATGNNGACSLVRADADTLNIRPEPNTSQAPLSTLSIGQTATRLDTVSGQTVNGTSRWYRISRAGVVGFISGAYSSCAN
ncbi:MAG: hypothetical protein FJ137_06275 [Deltaproteobacteria bacterium]|nr:hypothetical protein [Deltaproteobacteria bacterium]